MTVKAISSTDKLFFFLFSVALIALVSELSAGVQRLGALPIAAAFLIAAAGLSLLGSSVVSLAKLPQNWLSCPALLIGLGQLCLVSYIYLRSLLFQAANISQPFSSIELWAIALLLILGAARLSPQHLRTSFYHLAWFVPLLASIILLLTWRELPREVMLSSDPDQHFFFAAQIKRFGAVPFNQGIWGPKDFGYPAGFAALALVWKLLAFTHLGNALTIQPLLQTLLAITSLPVITAAVMGRSEQFPAKFCVQAGLLVIFFAAWPLTLETRYYHLEGSGRISVLLSLLLTVTLAAELAARLINNAEARYLSFVCGLLLAFSALINPINIIIPAAAFASAVGLPVLAALKIWRRVLSSALMLVLGAACLFLTEPYYSKQISALVLETTTPAHTQAASPINMSNIWKSYQESALSINNYLDPVSLPIAQDITQSSIILSILVLLLWISRAFTNRRLPLTVALLLSAFPLALIALALLVNPLFSALSGHAAFYLLAPYYSAALLQLKFLWVFALIAVVLFQIALIKTWAPAALLLCAAACFYPLSELRDQLKLYNLQPRYSYCGSMGCVQTDDTLVLREIEKMFETYRKSGSPMSFEEIPKILIPNGYFFQATEKWLMPSGASRVLPLYETFPAAFFYFQGSDDYSFENYRQNICESLNLDWLQQRNIRYLFVPADNRGACVKGLVRMARSNRVIFRSGKAMFIRIY